MAGEQVADAVSATSTLHAEGRLVTLDVLGEDVTDMEDARATTAAYIDLLRGLEDANAAAGTDLSLKLSALGQALPGDGPARALENARQICGAAAHAGCTVTLDMEDHTTVDSTFTIGTELRRDFPSTGNVFRSNLRRTAGDLRNLAGTDTRVRLVKGAYREPASVAHQRKADVDRAYQSDLTSLIGSRCYPMVATYDPIMLEHARTIAGAVGRTHETWEVQMLFGIRTDLQAAAVDRQEQLRVYVPFGTDWYGYFVRRLAERPANVAFFLRALRHA